MFFTLRILCILVYPQCILGVSYRIHVSYMYPISKLQASETCCILLFLQDTLRIRVGYTQILYPELLLGYHMYFILLALTDARRVYPRVYSKFWDTPEIHQDTGGIHPGY